MEKLELFKKTEMECVEVDGELKHITVMGDTKGKSQNEKSTKTVSGTVKWQMG